MATVISEERKRELVNTEFHQYFYVSLKSSKAFYNGFSHNIPVTEYVSANVDSLLGRYEVDFNWDDETESEWLSTIECNKVIDGDTVKLRDGRTVRLVGVNTPEKGVKGYAASKKFLEKICLDSSVELILKVDSMKPTDKYGRVLGVIYANGRNINKMLLKEGLAEIMYLPPSIFDPHDWDPNAPESNYDESLLAKNLEEQFLNAVIPFKEISGDDYGIGHLVKYLNNDRSNLVVTKADDFNVLYKFESYKDVLFVRVDPIVVSENKTVDICVHILPKRYDGTDSILIFKDDYDFLNSKGLKLEQNFSERFYNKNRFYEVDEYGEFILDHWREKIPTKIINAYFQSGLQGAEGRTDRFHIIEGKDYPEWNKFNNRQYFYQDYNEVNEWIRDRWHAPFDSDEEMFAEFYCNLSRFTGNMRNIQIDSGYSYNDSTGTSAIHYVGTKDHSNYDMADRCTLIDANLDNILTENGPTNYISQMEYVNGKPHFPITTHVVQQDNSYTHNHTNNIGEKHYKTTKYFNDRLYSEEKSINDDSEVINHGYTVGDWIDQSQ